MIPRGILWFCGKTQVKKSTHAVELAFAAKDAGWGAITAIDSMGAWNFRTWNRAAGRVELYAEIFGRRRDCAITPYDGEEVNAIYRTLHKMGTRRDELRRPRQIVLMDEAKFWISKRKLALDVSLAMRGWAHSESLYLFTTQRIADIHGDCLSIDCEIRIYQTLPGPDTDRLWEEYRIKETEAAALPVGSYITIRNGEVQRGGDGCPSVTAA